MARGTSVEQTSAGPRASGDLRSRQAPPPSRQGIQNVPVLLPAFLRLGSRYSIEPLLLSDGLRNNMSCKNRRSYEEAKSSGLLEGHGGDS